MVFRNRVILAATVALGLAMPVAAQDTELSAATVIARVGTTEITLGHLIAARESLPAQFQSLPDEAIFDGLLTQIIEQEVLVQQLEQPLSLREQLVRDNEERALDANLALARIARAAVTDEALQAAYDAAYGTAEPAQEFNASHIIVETEAEAAELLTRIQAGEDFAEVARAHSRDGAAASGGELGWFGLGMMVEPFENAVVAMQVGEVAGPIQTQFGWHLVRLNDTRMSEAPTLDAVRGELVDQIQRTAATEYLATLSQAEGIERLSDGIPRDALSRFDLLDE